MPLIIDCTDFQGSFLIGRDTCSDFQGCFNLLAVESPLLIRASVVTQHYLPRYAPDPETPGLYIPDATGNYVKNPDPSEFVTRYSIDPDSPDPENPEFLEDPLGAYVEDPASPGDYILRSAHPTNGYKLFITTVSHPNEGKYKTYAEVLEENGVTITNA